VTGAGKGIGRATALDLAARGHSVIAISRSPGDLKSLEAETQATYGLQKHLFLCVDLRSEDEIVSAFKEIRSKFTSVDALVNNAGSITKKKLEKMTLAQWRENFLVNVDATFLCTREALPLLKKSRYGASILNVSSLAGIRNLEKISEFGGYTAAKSALVGLTQAMAIEFKEYNIRVNAIAPGAVNTQMLRKAAPGFATRATPEHIAKIINFFITNDESSVVNSAILEIFCNDY
jgi:NAD(P)-dependent dehydrogenase (short-subunit alcohol dehydrogenase family)